MELETTDLERFASNVHGVDRLKYLWRGKGQPYQVPEELIASNSNDGDDVFGQYLDRLFLYKPTVTVSILCIRNGIN
jgi:hypothetical protein